MKPTSTRSESSPTDPAGVVQVVQGRRSMMKTGAGAIVGASALTSGWKLVGAQESSPDATPPNPETDICVLTPELTEGPYFLPDHLVRRDITEGRAGVPLKLKIGVLNPSSCIPIENVAVDIWHCDALGFYSGVGANSPRNGDPAPDDLETIADDNFLRGIQITDADGIVEFDTIYPGWYPGRAIHIHLMVHVDGDLDDGTDTYQGGRVAHTGQLFFDEPTNDTVFAEEPYASRVSTRLVNDDDRILGDNDEEPGFMLTLSAVTDGVVSDGYVGVITLGVDPDMG